MVQRAGEHQDKLVAIARSAMLLTPATLTIVEMSVVRGRMPIRPVVHPLET